MRSQDLGGALSLVALRARERAPNSFRRRITRLGRSRSSASTSGSSDQRDGARESAHHTRARLRAVATGRRRPTTTGTPNDRGTSRGFLLRRARPPVPRALDASWSSPRATSRTRLRHRRGDRPCGRSLIARPHGVKLGVTMRVHRVRHRPRGQAAPFSGRSGQPRVDSTTQFIVAGQRGVIMRGRRGSRYWPPARRRTRKSSVGRHARHRPHADGQTTRRCLRSSDCWHARPLVRFSTRPSRSRIVLSKRAANESRHLRPVLVREPARRVDR